MPYEPERLRSFLFVPACDVGLVQKAAHVPTDAVILDLEDAVEPTQKRAARDVAGRALSARPSAAARIVRINAAGTPFFADDLELLSSVQPDAIVVPKIDLLSLAALGPSVPPVIGLIESALGLQQAEQIAADPRVVQLALGAADLGLELGLETREDALELLHPRTTLVLVSATGRCAPPIDSVFLNIKNLGGLEREARLSRSLGFGGKACIHPGHVPIINSVFTPSATEIARARDLLDEYDAAAAAGIAVSVSDGEMVDRPVVEQARKLLARADTRGL